MTEAPARLKRFCGCGTLVWDVPGAPWLPRYTESIICPNCGADHSRKAPLWWVARFAWRRFGKFWRYYRFGLVGRLTLRYCFQYRPPAPKREEEPRAAGQQPVTTTIAV